MQTRFMEEQIMLVVSRKDGEGLWIQPGIRVVVLESRSGKVRLGLEAPPDVSILRDEIRSRAPAENAAEPVPV